jgi:hypothetical protein
MRYFVCSTFLILVTAIQFNNLLYMAWDPLNPSLNSLLLKLLPMLNLVLLHLLAIIRSSSYSCTSLQPRPCWFYSVEIWRVAALQETRHLLFKKRLILDPVGMRRSFIFLYNSMNSRTLATLCKR